MKAILVGLSALAAAVALAPSHVSATTITLTYDSTATPNGDGALLGPGVSLGASSGTVVQTTGANTNDGWDPWGGTDTNSAWLSVGGANGSTPNSSQTINTAVSSDLLTLLWGSPNSNNTLTLFNGSTSVGVISFVDGTGFEVNGTPVSLLPPGTPTPPNVMDPGDIITIDSSALFTSAVLTNGIGGFEVADVSALNNGGDVTTPLPPAWTMLLAGLVALGFLANRGTKSRPAGLAAA
jgi:hypothetical protein